MPWVRSVKRTSTGGEAVRRFLITSAAAVALLACRPSPARRPRQINVGDDFFYP